MHDKRLPNTEPKLLELFTNLVAKFGTVLMIVDQVANIGALPLTVARAAGCRVAYPPGLSMRRAADLHPGKAKTDARDAFVIAETARSMPHTLRAVDRDDEVLGELTMLTGYDNDLAGEVSRTTNRLRGLLSRSIPPRACARPSPGLPLRSGPPGPARLSGKAEKLGRVRCEALLKANSSRMAHHLTTEIYGALAEQTLVVPGTEASALIVPGLAAQLAAAHTQRRQTEQEIAALLEALPLFHLLTSLPGMGVRTTAAVIAAIGDGTGFPTAGHLASYAGLAPATKSSGTSIHGEHAPPRQPAPQTCPVPGRVRRDRLQSRPVLPDLLRPSARPGQDPHPDRAPSRPPTRQRHTRGDPQRHPLRTPHPRSRCLTGASPCSSRPRRVCPQAPPPLPCRPSGCPHSI
ncbi:transposase [Streptomyces sp. NBC_00378]|uniref:IS110 family transposase n=1 Tax=unclassified Streptomyces TaxID=2593676 RepID=UPI002252D296|nr:MULTISPECIES: transposase [unclassified Streptomyces]MCX5113219.1 transposase [Streptomyces sp. NBC_00378]